MKDQNEFVKQYAVKKKELTSLETRRTELEKEQRATEAKWNEAKKVLFNSELDEVQLLRKVWSTRKTDNALRQFDAEETGSVANVCEPTSWHEEGLDSLRAEVDAALRGIYPTDAVEKMRTKVEELRRSTKSLEVLLNKRIPEEIEAIEVKIATLKSEVSKLERAIWIEAYEAAKKDIQEYAFPSIRRAFILVNGHNPRFWRWPDPAFFFHLFQGQKISVEEVLSEREELRKEIFKS